jgi:hypothetical protein
MRQTEVGIKCPDDARLPRGARAGVMKNSQIAKSFLAGIAVAVLGVPVVFAMFQIGFLTFILSAAAGYGAGTLIHRAGGRNGGPLAMAIAGGSVFIAYAPFMVPQLLNGNFPLFVLLPALLAVGFAVYTNRP